MSSELKVTTNTLRYQTRLACGLIPLLNRLRDQGVDINAMLRTNRLHTFELFDPAFTITLHRNSVSLTLRSAISTSLAPAWH